MMKKKFATVLVFSIIVLFFCGNCWAGAATPVEVMEKVQAAIKLIEDKGEKAALPMIRDKNGPFVWKDSYVVVKRMDGTLLAHPYRLAFEGTNQLGTKDVKGKAFEIEMRDIIKENGSGWVDYFWNKPDKLTPSYKVTYVMKVPNTDLFCSAGIYDLRKDDVMKILHIMGKS